MTNISNNLRIKNFFIKKAILFTKVHFKVQDAYNLNKKRASYLYRTAQPSTLASFRTWGDSTGAGRIRLARTTKVVYFLIPSAETDSN